MNEAQSNISEKLWNSVWSTILTEIFSAKFIHEAKSLTEKMVIGKNVCIITNRIFLPASTIKIKYSSCTYKCMYTLIELYCGVLRLSMVQRQPWILRRWCFSVTTMLLPQMCGHCDLFVMLQFLDFVFRYAVGASLYCRCIPLFDYIHFRVMKMQFSHVFKLMAKVLT